MKFELTTDIRFYLITRCTVFCCFRIIGLTRIQTLSPPMVTKSIGQYSSLIRVYPYNKLSFSQTWTSVYAPVWPDGTIGEFHAPSQIICLTNCIAGYSFFQLIYAVVGFAHKLTCKQILKYSTKYQLHLSFCSHFKLWNIHHHICYTRRRHCSAWSNSFPLVRNIILFSKYTVNDTVYVL